MSTEDVTKHKASYFYDIAVFLPAGDQRIGNGMHGYKPNPACPLIQLDDGRDGSQDVVDWEKEAELPGRISAAGVLIDVELAEASRPEDLQAILAHIRNSTGCAHLNQTVQERFVPRQANELLRQGKCEEACARFKLME